MIKQIFSAGLFVLLGAHLNAAEPFLLFHDRFATEGRESAPLSGRVIAGSYEDATYLGDKDWVVANGKAALPKGADGQNAFVEVGIQEDRVYTLSCTLNVIGGVNSDKWMAFGFAERPAGRWYANGSVGAFLARVDGETLVARGNGFPDSQIIEDAKGQPKHLKIVLDTKGADKSKWTLAFLINDRVVGPAKAIGVHDFNIRYAGFGGEAAWGEVGDFSLSVSPGPALNPVLFDFEDQREINLWANGLARKDVERLTRSDVFATSGKHSMKVVAPAAPHADMFHAHAPPPVRNWQAYEYFSMDIHNPTDKDTVLGVILGDGPNNYGTPSLWSGYKYQITIPARTTATHAFHLGAAKEVINLKNVSGIFVYNEYVPDEIVLHFDNLRLSRDRDALVAGMSAPLRQQTRETMRALHARAAREIEPLAAKCAPSPAVAGLKKKMEDLLDEAGGGVLVHPGFRNALNGIRTALGREAMMQQWVKSTPFANERLLVAHAPSTVKIMPAKEPSALDFGKDILISAARSEKESFQIAVTPRQPETVRNVSLSVGDLASPTGAVFSSKNIQVATVGFVQTRKLPPYAVQYERTWWPDPLLEELKSVDVAQGTVQSFWVRCRVPKDQAAGEYRGSVKVLVDGMPVEQIPLTLKVYPFFMPERPPIPVATSFIGREESLLPGDTKVIRDVIGTAEYHKTVKYQHADFLADYFLDYNSLYTGPPDFDVLSYLHEKGRLGTFNLGFFGPGASEATGQIASLDKLKALHDTAAARGLIEHAYIYGFDEQPVTQQLADAARNIKKLLPDSFILSTAKSPTYGMGDPLAKDIDGWVPLTHHYKASLAGKARQEGKQVWWYICNWPMPPYANWFLECDAIEARLLMGAMARKYQPDGFLYYATALFRDNKALGSDTPFTSWRADSFDAWHGDGQLLYFGEKGQLIPSIRLENFRDGLEDYACARILESMVAKGKETPDLRADQQEWLAQAEEALEVPPTLVESLTQYNRSTADLYEWRDRIAGAIASSPFTEVNPWQEDFRLKKGKPRQPQAR